MSDAWAGRSAAQHHIASLVEQRRKQWQKHRVSTKLLKRQNFFVHAVGRHDQCASICYWYCRRGISTIIAAPYAPPRLAQKWIPTVRISTPLSPASNPGTDTPKRVSYGCKRCNCRCACIYNSSVTGVY